MERIVTSLTGIALEETDEKIRLLKEQALLRDIQNFYIYFQELKPSTTTPPTEPYYPLFGTEYTLQFKDFHQLNDTIYKNKSMYTIELLNGSVNKNASVSIINQPLYIKLDALSDEPYDFVISSNVVDKLANNVIHYISDSFPKNITLKIGHMTNNSTTGITAFYDFNANVNNTTGEPVFFDQQLYLLELRFRVKQIHLF